MRILTPLIAFFLIGCGQEKPAVSSPTPSANTAPSARPVFLFLGDSLTAGYGVAQDEAYPALLAKRWQQEGRPYEVRNAGVSGSTTRGVLENLDWNMDGRVHTVFLAIGANDGLRGLDLVETEKNLDAIIRGIRARGARVILAGMKIPPNYGPQYTDQFEAMFAKSARTHNLRLMPFLLKDVAAHTDLNIEDGIHPNARGHAVMAHNVHTFLTQEKLIP